ncbi:MAG: glycosyltransferase [Bacteroidales bacterium]|nr:glycosyltransferase [Bacteroidales bacterium]
MNILSISSILPIPGYLRINDFVFEFYSHYKKEFKLDKIYFIHPIKYSNKFIRKILRENSDNEGIYQIKSYKYDNFNITIFKYLSIQRFKNLHSLLSNTLFLLNKKKIEKIITDNKIDVIHAQYIFPDGMLAYKLWKKYRIPYLITTHNEIKYFKHNLSKNLAKRILKNSFCVTPINFTNYQTFLKNNINNIKLIPLGFDEKLPYIKRNTHNKDIKIITIAELIKLKNIDKVITALKNLANKYNFTYTIVGEGPEKNNLVQLIKSYDLEKRVKLIGKVPYEKIGEILINQDIFIMISYFETFGRVYFEAMSMKIPIICAKNSGIFGFFKEMTEGISVKHDDIEDIIQKIELLISDETLRRSIGKNGFELVKQYTWKNLTYTFNKLYSDSIV